MKPLLPRLAITGLLMTVAPASAHHSFAASYVPNKKMAIEGVLVTFLFRNPHSFVQVEAPDDSGNVVRWAVEWASGGQLGQQGVTRDTLKPGDHVIVVGYPGRNPADHLLRAIQIAHPSFGSYHGTL